MDKTDVDCKSQPWKIKFKFSEIDKPWCTGSPFDYPKQVQ